MAFIKQGGNEGKIEHIIDSKELTDEQKKAARELSHQSNDQIDFKAGKQGDLQ